ncbi:MAG: recombinase RecT [Desulfobacterium sp.]|nr:recombinase RecT [Desulfobacterium sp.]
MNMPATANQNRAVTLKQSLARPDIQARIEERLGQKAGNFMASILDLSGENHQLQKCDPNLVIKECLKAAALDLPINKNLGFAYVIPYNESSKVGNQWIKTMTPRFQMGYKGFIQLAIRTGQYKHLNAGVVYEGEEMVVDRIRGTLTIEGKATSEKPAGYFSYMQLVNGFEKAIGWSVEKVMAHGQKFSKSFGKKTSPWKTNTEAMCLKTMIMQLIPKYGPMSIELTQAMTQDRSDVVPFDQGESRIQEEANQGEVIDINPEVAPEETRKPEPVNGGEITEEEKAEIVRQESEAEKADEPARGPGF